VTNSVNFPNTALAPLSSQYTRLCLINQNRPGMIGAITSLLGERGVNIAQQARAHARTHAHMHAGTGTHRLAQARGTPPPPRPPLPPPPAQINTSRGEIAYNVVDISDAEGANGADGAEATLAALHGLEGGAARLTCTHDACTMPATMRPPYEHAERHRHAGTARSPPPSPPYPP
jgi:hypothetical protein